jgi:hypothetical protein
VVALVLRDSQWRKIEPGAQPRGASRASTTAGASASTPAAATRTTGAATRTTGAT